MIRKFFRREHSAPKSMRKALTTALFKPVQIMLPFVLMYGVVSLLVRTGIVPQVAVMPEPNRPTQDLKIEAPVSLLEKHRAECWTGSEKPKAELPGAAIVQFKDGRVVYTNKHALVDAAFNEVLASVGYGDKISDLIDPIALCE